MLWVTKIFKLYGGGVTEGRKRTDSARAGRSRTRQGKQNAVRWVRKSGAIGSVGGDLRRAVQATKSGKSDYYAPGDEGRPAPE